MYRVKGKIGIKGNNSPFSSSTAPPLTYHYHQNSDSPSYPGLDPALTILSHNILMPPVQSPF